MLRRILDLDDGFQGILAFTLPEALWLSKQGFEDIVVGYPTADREAIAELAALASAEPPRAPVLMVDDSPHLDLIEGAMGAGAGGGAGCASTSTSAGGPAAGGSRGSARSARRSTTRAGAARLAAEIERAAGRRASPG